MGKSGIGSDLIWEDLVQIKEAASEFELLDHNGIVRFIRRLVRNRIYELGVLTLEAQNSSTLLATSFRWLSLS